jgi:hypothetical protein
MPNAARTPSDRRQRSAEPVDGVARSGTLPALMDRETALLLALGMLIAASLTVGVSGWVILIRDRRPARAAHHRADTTEGS